jgi:splicing factor 3B subunit 2
LLPACSKNQQGTVSLIPIGKKSGNPATNYLHLLNSFQAKLAKEDLSDMVAEHAAKQSSKRKRQAGKDDNKPGKKYKEFKF